MLKEYTHDINQINNRLINLSLLSFSILFLPLIVSSYTRISTSGFTPMLYILTPIFLCFSITYVLRNYLSFKMKLMITLIGLYTLALAAFLSYGLLGMGISILFLFNMFIALFTNKRTMIGLGIFSILTVIVFAYLITNHLITFDFVLEDYFYEISTWTSQTLGLCLLTFIAMFTISNMMSYLNDSMTKEIENKEILQSLVEGMDDIIYRIDDKGNIESANKSFFLAVGLDRDYLIGKHYSIIFNSIIFENHDSINIWHEKIDEAFKIKLPVRFHFAYESLKGENLIADVKLIPVINEFGDVTSLIGNNRDITSLITAKKQVEDILRNENIKLEELVKERTTQLENTLKELMTRERLASLGNLVAGIAHEINTPLGVAVTASTFLTDKNSDVSNKLKNGKLSKNNLVDYIDTVDETSQLINSSLFRAADLITSFKDISVKQSSEIKAQFNLNGLLKSVIKTLKHEYKNTQNKIQLQVDDHLWLDSYPGSFSQIFTHLIMNSLTHAFTQGYQGIIEINSQHQEDKIVLIYKDNGIGISEEHLKKIYDPFFTTNRSKGGNGLGMSIVYNIVTDQLNGSIHCESELNHGVVITIVLENNILIEKGELNE